MNEQDHVDFKKEPEITDDACDCDNSRSKEEPNINTDDRKKYDWESRYPKEAKRIMLREAIYIALTGVLATVLLYLNYIGALSQWLLPSDMGDEIFRNILFFTFAGLLGGTVFGLKYFYRVVARGYWSEDRKYWRYFSPFISMAIAFIVGCMASSGLLNSQNSNSNAWATAFGFFAGYFADEAVGKMYEIAVFVFGKNSSKK